MFTMSVCRGPLSSSKYVGPYFLKRQSRKQVSQDIGVLKDVQCFHNVSSQPVVAQSAEVTCVQC